MTIIPWRTQWNAISARIEGLVRAGEFFYQSIQTYSSDSRGASKNILLPQAEALYDQLETYRQKHTGALPSQAIEALDRFLKEYNSVFKSPETGNTLDQRLPFVQIRLTALASFRSEMEYCLSGLEEQIRTAAERGFLHLQRCIVADSHYRDRWKAAFKDGELACERLGAVHLLWHGVWAFKVDAEGGRTDLVMGTQIDNPSQASQLSLGLVLTEWKVARRDAEVKQKHREAQKQASLYSGGILGGIELASLRYLVVVTKDYTEALSDNVEDDITYRFVNIAVDPKQPSKIARESVY